MAQRSTGVVEKDSGDGYLAVEFNGLNDAINDNATDTETRVGTLETDSIALDAENRIGTLETDSTTLDAENRIGTLETDSTTLDAENRIGTLETDSVTLDAETRITDLENAGGGGILSDSTQGSNVNFYTIVQEDIDNNVLLRVSTGATEDVVYRLDPALLPERNIKISFINDSDFRMEVDVSSVIGGVSENLSFDSTDVNVPESITYSSHGFVTGQKVYYTAGGDVQVGGLIDKQAYYVKAQSANILRLYNTKADADADSNNIQLDTITMTGTSHKFRSNPANSNINGLLERIYIWSGGSIVTIAGSTTEEDCNTVAGYS